MIVQTTITKNESFLLKEMMPIWQKYADGFVFYDDSSDDDTIEFLEENKEKYNILSIIRGKEYNIDKDLKIETDMRGELFNEAKKFSNYITCLDSDEYFDGSITKDEFLQMLKSNPDTLFCFQWIQYTSKNEIRVDGPWRYNFKDRAGSYISPNTAFEKTLMHSLHLPCPPNGNAQIPADKLFIAHCQWLDKRWVGVKQYFWKIVDYINKSKHSQDVYDPSAYDASVNNFDWEYGSFETPLKIDENIYSHQDIKENFKLKAIKYYTQKYNIPNLNDWGMGIYEYAAKKETKDQDFIPMYFCTAADSTHFPALLNLIGSIHKHNFNETKEIAVFDLGLEPQQINTIEELQKVKVYAVERVNPLITEPLYNCPNRWIRGLFSWKPVVIKQSLQMFPYVLYTDAGTTFQKPLNNLFKHIKQNKYFISDCGHSIKWMTTRYIIDKLQLELPERKWLLNDDTLGIDAGFIGLSKELEEEFVTPIYELSREIQNFIDDGTCPDGWGTSRHDQTLFSIKARELNYTLSLHDRENEECFTVFDDKKEPFHITHMGHRVNSDTYVFRCRRNVPQEIFNSNIPYIRKNK